MLFGVVWVYWAGVYIYRFFQLRKLPRKNPPVTRWHWAELLLNMIASILLAVEFIWSIAKHQPWFKTAGAFFVSLAWVASLSITYHEYKRGEKHSWPIISWLVAAFVIQSLKIQAMMNTAMSRNELDFVIAVLLFAIYGILGIASFAYNNSPPTFMRERFDGISAIQPDDTKQVPLDFGKSDTEGDTQQKEEEEIVYGAYPESPLSPEESASIFSTITFGWLTPLMRLGYTRPLQAPDMPKLSKVDSIDMITDDLEQSWLHQIRTHNNSFFRALISSYGLKFALSGILKLIQDIMLFVGPYLLKLLIQFIENKNEPFWHGLLYALAMGIAAIFQSAVLHAYFFRVFRIGQQIRASIAGMVYRKAFKMSFESRKLYTVGEMVNHQSIDTSRLEGTMPYLHMLWSGPFQIVVSLIFLYQIVGVSVFAGLAVLLLMIPINVQITRVLSVIQKEMMGHKDSRNKIVNEVLQGIRIIKYFAWERSFERKVLAAREVEVNALRRGSNIRAWTSFLWTASPVIVSLATFTVFTLLGNSLTPQIAFPALALFNILRFPINALPNVISGVVDSQVSIGRLQKYFLMEELDESAVEEDIAIPSAIRIEQGRFEWESGRNTISNINIDIPSGKLVAVVGEVGSGKSSLLSALLGEIPKVSGRVVVNGKVAYCHQQAWIQNTSLRNNVTFGSEFDPALYADVVDVCELRSDLLILPAGDLTEIGEKGINLSGGQKQRVSLARAVYQNADVYLFDDPLSAVDAHIGRSLFQNCIKRQLDGKTRILVTHQLQYLSQVDYIFLMSGGCIVESGTYQQLMASRGALCKLVEAHVSDHDHEHDDSSNHTQTKEGNSSTPSSSSTSSSSEDQASNGKDTYNNGATDADKKKKDQGKQIMAEERATGSVGMNVYVMYAGAIGGAFITGLILLFFILDSGSKIAGDWWLNIWAQAAESPSMTHSHHFYLGIYAILALSNSVFILVRSFMLIFGGIRAAVTLHNKMLHAVLRAPISWYDQVPLGRILNRFSKDQYALDESLMRTLTMALSTLFVVISVAIVVGAITPWILVAVLPLAFLYRYIQQFYLESSREIQRLSSISRSPIFALFSETIAGISTIRGYSKASDFIIINESKIAENQKAYFASTTANRWLGMRLEFVGTCVVFGSAFFAVLSRNSLAAGLAGLSITYALQLTSQLNWMVRMSTDVENELVSVERCVQYSNLEPEADEIVEPRPDQQWPYHGGIEFNNLSLRYREGLPLVLKNVNVKIKPKEKIGVVGRTGAGKSSLMNALFRITEAASGNIVIDGINTSTIGLEDLRSRLAIIPQDPTLFAGTIRSNLDPFGDYSDPQLWHAIQSVSLKDQIELMPGKLDAPVSEFGENLSVGSRQLMCLARALLRKPKILVMDEATASIDYVSDGKIQKTIREQFQDATVLTIAHRIATIADSDRVMVLDFGNVVEFDSPKTLLQNPNSIYYSLASKSRAVLEATAH